MEEREPISLRHHRRTYPRHLIYRLHEIVHARFKAKRLFDAIKWE